MILIPKAQNTDVKIIRIIKITEIKALIYFEVLIFKSEIKVEKQV